jgi:YD repeat-containing protein
MTNPTTFATLLRVLMLTIGTALLAPAAGVAQSSGSDPVFDASGKQPNRDYFGQLDFERIDTLSGNVVLSFTDVELPGPPGLQVTFQRHMNTKGLGGFGLAGVPMRINGEVGDPEIPVVCPACPPSTPRPVSEWLPKLVMADGSEIWTAWEEFYDDPNYSGPERWRWAVSNDFSRFDRYNRRLYLPDGRTADYEPGLGGRLLRIRTPFSPGDGSYEIRINYGPLLPSGRTNDTIIQELGNGQIRTIYAPGGLLYGPSQLVVTADGQQRTWTYDGVAGNEAVVQPPAGPAWRFGYETLPSGHNVLSYVRTPDGGQISYTWARHLFSRDVGGEYEPTVLENLTSTVVTSRTVSGPGITGGTWIYEYIKDGVHDATRITHPVAPPTPQTRTIMVYGIIGRSLVRRVAEDGYATYATGAYGVIERRTESYLNGQWPVAERETREYVELPVTNKPEMVRDKVAELKKTTIVRDGRSYTKEHFYATWTNLAGYHQPWQTLEDGGGLSRAVIRTFDNDDAPYIVGRVASELITGAPGEGFTTSWAFDAQTGFVTSRTENGITMRFEPAAGGFVGAAIDAHDHRTSFTYDWGVQASIDTAHEDLTREIDPIGTVHTETVRNGKTTTYVYDALNRVLEAHAPGSHVTRTTYDNVNGRSALVARGSWSVRKIFDGFGRELRTETSDGVVRSRRYDADGRLTFRSLPWDPANAATPEVGTTSEYDSLGRVVRRVSHQLPASSWSYDVAPGAGPRVTYTDEKGRTSVATFKAFGHPSDARLSSLLDAKGNTWSYTYNALGKVTGVTAPDGKTRTWTYDGDLLSEEQHPESGVTRYSYDGAGRLSEKTDARGTVFAYGYDGNDRVNLINAVKADRGAVQTRIEFENNSSLQTRISEGDTSTVFGYDDASRVTSRIDNVRGRPFTTTYTYDNHGNLTKLKYRDGLEVSYEYNGTTNRLTRVEDVARARVFARNFSYHPSGAVTSVVLGDDSVQTFSLDGRYRPDAITSTRDGQQILNLDYDQYDNADNLGRLRDLRPGGTGGTQTFGYDELDRLATANGPYGGLAYYYDAHGNRVTGAGTTAYAYDPDTMRLIQQGINSFGYDANGNLTQFNAATQYRYDANNRMTSVDGQNSHASYEYGADGQRKVRSVSGATFLYVHDPAGRLLSEYLNHSDRATPNRDYIYAGAKLIAAIQPPERVVLPDVRVALSVPEMAFEAPATIPLTADVVKPEGMTVERVDFYRGGEVVGWATSAPYTFTVTPVGEGTYKFSAKLKLTNNRIAFSSPLTITVIPTGRPTDLTFSKNPALDTDTVTLTVGVLAPCGALGFDFGNGEYIVDAVSAYPHVRTYRWTTPGTYTVRVDGHGNCRNTLSRTITINPANPPPTATLTSPAAGASFLSGTPITLSANAADTNGTVQRVDFFAGPSLIGSDPTSPYSLTWSNVPPGDYTLTAVAVDNLNATGRSAPVSVSVVHLNGVTVTPSPVAVNQNATVTVNGGGACGSVEINYGDGTVVTYANVSWPFSQSHAWSTGGTKTVSARGQGDCFGTVSTTVTVNSNPPPAVALTSPANGSSVAAPASISLSATATDGDGVNRVEFYSGSTLIGTDTTSPFAKTWGPGIDAGTYTFTARAFDQLGASATSAAATVTVRHVAAVSASPSTVVTGQSSSITVTGSATCGAVQIDYGDGSVITYPLSGLPTTQTHAWATGGTKTITVTGQATCTGIVTTAVTVNANAAPMVSLTAPANGAVITAGSSLTLTATASDTHGVQRVEFYAGATLVGTDTTSPYSVSWSNVPSGSHSLTARAYDIHGANATSAAVSISAQHVISASPSPSTVVVGQSSSITVTGSGACGSVQINWGDGAVITYALSGLPTTQSHAWTTAGAKTVTVTGQSTCTGVVTTTVTVNGNTAPTVSMTAPASGTVVAVGATATLSANASDGDGINRVEFYAGATLVGTDTTSPYSVSWTVPAGSHSLTARAFDAFGASTNSAAVTLSAQHVLSASAAPSTVVVGQGTSLTVTGSAACGAVQINWGDGSVITYPLSGLPTTQTHAWVTSGAKTVTVTGQSTCTGTVSTTVQVDANPAPMVSLTSPANGATYQAPGSVVLSATASDPHGIQRVEFFYGASLLATLTTAPYSTTWPGLPAGTYTVTARAYDSYGASATSAASTITVSNGQVTAVTVTTPGTRRQNQTITAQVTGTNPCQAVEINWGDGAVITYPITSLPTSQTHAWTTSGTKTIIARGQGGNCTGTVSTTVYIDATPTVSITSPIAGQTFVGPASVTINAAASDAEGVSRVDFYVNGVHYFGDTASPWSFPWTNVANGSYSLTAMVTDSSGGTAMSAAVPITVNAAGPSRVTSIVVSPPRVNQAATITVYGTNPCGAVQINFGDGNAPYLPITGLPYTTTWTWTTTGPKTVTASGQGNCSGITSTSIVVNP